MSTEKKYFEFYSIGRQEADDISSKVFSISKELKVKIQYFTVVYEPRFASWIVRAIFEYDIDPIE